VDLPRYLDVAEALMIDSFVAGGDSLHGAVERVSDLALEPEELRRKQNAEAIKKITGVMKASNQQGRRR